MNRYDIPNWKPPTDKEKNQILEGIENRLNSNIYKDKIVSLQENTLNMNKKIV